MVVTLEIPEGLALQLGPAITQISREALGLEALRQGLWTEAELGRFLDIPRLSLDQFLKDHGVELDYTWEDVKLDREAHLKLSSS